MPGECDGDDRALNRPRFFKAEIADALEQSRVEIERGERHRRDVAKRGFERRRSRPVAFRRARVRRKRTTSWAAMSRASAAARTVASGCVGTQIVFSGPGR